MPSWSRDSLKKFIGRRYNTRVHMSLILAACGLSSMLASWFMLHFGIHSMLVRYPVAISLSYATFLIGVWTWLRATGLIEGRAPDDASNSGKKGKGSWFDFGGSGGSWSSSGGGGGGGGGGSIGGIARGGGTFDGGGASASFAEARVPVAIPMMQANAADANVVKSPGSSSSSSWGSKAGGIFDGIDGDGVVLLILAVALVGVVLITSGYLIWCAPDVLTEAAFGAALTGTLSRSAREHAGGGWVAGVVKKTWWPFALVLVAAMAFAGWSAAHYPQASTFREAIVAAIHSQ